MTTKAMGAVMNTRSSRADTNDHTMMHPAVVASTAVSRPWLTGHPRDGTTRSAACLSPLDPPAGAIRHRAYCRAMDTRQRSSGEMRLSSSSAPTSICTQWTVPGNRLVASSYSSLTVEPLSHPTSVVSS